MRIPSSLPFMFTGLKVAAVLSMIGAIVGEYFGGPTNALGVSILNDTQLFDFPRAWAGIALASAFGIAFYAAVALVERLTTSWHPSHAAFAASDGGPEWQPRGRRGRTKPEEGELRKKWVMAVAVLACTAFATWVAVAAAAPKKKAATKVTLQLKWVTQAQFAGYYAALEKGYYDKAGLDVTIKVGGPSITPETVVAGKRRSSGSTGSRTCSPRARRDRTSSRSPRSSRGRG